MQPKNLVLSLSVALSLSAPARVFADNGSYSGSGGSFSTGTSAGQAIAVQGLPLAGTNASLSFNCPITTFGGGTYQLNWKCAGGTVTISSSDNSLLLNGTFSNGSMSFSGGGGGKGGHVTYWYQFNGAFTGQVTSGGVTEGVNGSISQAVKTSSQIGAGSAPVTAAVAGWNSAYSPVVVADLSTSRLLAADNITGANLVTYGNSGSGVGQFSSIAGLAHDTANRIYVADGILDRVARIDDFTGKNWVDLGVSGAGTKQFSHPTGLAIDSTGKIWVADSGNNRIVRFDDMTGKNWTAFGTAGTGFNQFSGPTCVAFDTLGRIYVCDAGNSRIVRFDDLNGTNWTTLAVVDIGVYGYPISSPIAISVQASGLIDVARGDGYLLSVTDMTGANGTVSYWGATLSGMSTDAVGTLYVSGNFSPGLAQTVNAAGTGYFASALGGIAFTPGPVLAQASSSPTPAAPLLSAAALAFGSRNVGEPGTAQQITVTNLGATSLPIASVTASPDFILTNGCPPSLGGGASCTLSVRFDPIATGARSGTLLFESTSVHPSLSVELSGTGTAPTAVLLPHSLSFQPQQTGIASGPQTVTLTNAGTGPLTVPSITPSGDFSASSNCPGVLSPGYGCTISVVFTPTTTGTRSGSLVIADDALPTGTQQTVALAGSGLATVPTFTLSPGSLYFPDQLISTASKPQNVTLTNHAPGTVTLSAPTYPAQFKGTTTCKKTLATGASCTYQIHFAPTASGPISGVVSFPIAGHGSLTLGVSGTGTHSTYPAALSFNPPVVDFGALQTGDNPSINLVITNTSGLPTGIQSIVRSGSGAFTITGNNCPAVLAGGASCTVQVTFQPVVTAIFSGNLKFSESSGAITNVALAGSATVDGS